MLTKEMVKDYVEEDLKKIKENKPDKADLSLSQEIDNIYNYLKINYKPEKIKNLKIFSPSKLAQVAYQKNFDYSPEIGDRLIFHSSRYTIKGLWEIIDIYEKRDGTSVIELGKVGKRGNVLAERNNTRMRYKAGGIIMNIRKYNSLAENSRAIELVKN